MLHRPVKVEGLFLAADGRMSGMIPHEKRNQITGFGVGIIEFPSVRAAASTDS